MTNSDKGKITAGPTPRDDFTKTDALRKALEKGDLEKVIGLIEESLIEGSTALALRKALEKGDLEKVIGLIKESLTKESLIEGSTALALRKALEKGDLEKVIGLIKEDTALALAAGKGKTYKP